MSRHCQDWDPACSLPTKNWLRPTWKRTTSRPSGGSWNGRGITSSLAGGSTSIGYGNPADVELDDDLQLFAAPPADVFVGLTVAGDANLDRTVNLADFGLLRAGFGGPGPWTNGDFNYDDNVNLADFGLLRSSFGSTFSSSPIVSLFDDPL